MATISSLAPRLASMSYLHDTGGVQGFRGRAVLAYVAAADQPHGELLIGCRSISLINVVGVGFDEEFNKRFVRVGVGCADGRKVL